VSKHEISRRDLLARSAGAALATLPAWYAQEALAAEAVGEPAGRDFCANDQLNLACIGTGGSRGGFRQGLGVTHGLARQPGVKVVAVCDLDRLHREEAVRSFGPACQGYADFREVLERRDVDAVVIGTPDHWHALIAIAAMKAKKDVYCEKPLTLFIAEGRAIANTQAKTKRVFQVGSQQRSDGRFRLACELVRNGRIGKLRRIEARLPNGARGGPFEPKPVPEGFDWDMWLGPSHATEYVPERTHGSFRHWYEYSGGMMTDWGAHHLDISQWAVGADASGPVSVEATGVLPCHPRGFNAPLDFEVTYTYPGDVTLVAMSKGENGVHFEGSDGWIFVSRERIGASSEAILKDPLPDGSVRLYRSDGHGRNFLECVRSRKETICPAEVGHRSATVCHLGNISLRMGGRRLQWDPERERFSDDEANLYVSRPYRKPWSL